MAVTSGAMIAILMRAIILNARSRGGLTPSTSKGTRRQPRRRTSPAASG